MRKVQIEISVEKLKANMINYNNLIREINALKIAGDKVQLALKAPKKMYISGTIDGIIDIMKVMDIAPEVEKNLLSGMYKSFKVKDVEYIVDEHTDPVKPKRDRKAKRHAL